MIPLSPIAHPRIDLFLLGFIVATSAAAAVFFLRFWRSTRDPLFMAFAVFFVVQVIGHSAVLELERPNEGSFWLFFLRLLAVVAIAVAILWKNLMVD